MGPMRIFAGVFSELTSELTHTWPYGLLFRPTSSSHVEKLGQTVRLRGPTSADLDGAVVRSAMGVEMAHAGWRLATKKRGWPHESFKTEGCWYLRWYPRCHETCLFGVVIGFVKHAW